MDIVKEVKKLGLPKGSYIVFGSGALAMRGIRETKDIDLVVTKKVYNNLKKEGWKEEEPLEGRPVVTSGNYEAAPAWNFGDYNPSLKELLETADYIDGVPFANLREVIKWKKAFGRENDLKDIKLIKNYLEAK